MATTGTGFDVPIQLNLERRERQQQRTEEDHAQKIQDLLTQRSSIVSKIGDYEKGSPEYQQSMDALQKVNLGIVDAYHPDKNPGAIQKLGHLLTDHLGITSPQKRADATAAKQQTKTANAKSQSEMEVAAGPLSPTQRATADAQAKASGNLALMQANLKNLKTLFPDASPEQMKAWQNEMALAFTGGKPINERYFTQPITTKDDDGNEHYWRVPMDPTLQPEEVDFNGQKIVPKAHASTAQFNERLAAYAKDHGTTVEALPEAAYSYVRQMMAKESAMPSSNTTTRLVQDANGQWVPVTEINQRTPGAGINPVDPLGPIDAGHSGGTPSSKPSGAKSSTSKSNSPPKGGKESNVHVGNPLFQGRTPAITKAQNDVIDATKLSSIADQVAKKPDDAINQKRLAVQLERASAGRFTTQALDYVIKSGWGNTIEQWANNPSTGALPKDVIRQLVDGAHENLKAAKIALQSAVTPSGGDASPQQNYKHTATNPGTKHKIGTNDDPDSPNAKWFDLQTGKQI